MGFALELGNSQTVKARRTLLCSLFYLCQHKVMAYSVTVCCSGCQMPPGSASYFTSFCLTGRVLGILQALHSRCQPCALPTAAQVRSRSSGAVRRERGRVLCPGCGCQLRARRLTSTVREQPVTGRVTLSRAPGCARKFKTYIFFLIKCAVPCGRPALRRRASSPPQLS